MTVPDNGETPAALPPRRKWTALVVATFLVMVGYWAFIVAFAAGAEENGLDPGPPFALGLAMVPLAYAALAFMSRRENAYSAVLKAMGAWLLVALVVGFINVVVGLVAGYGVGGMLALRAEEVHGWKTRLAAVAIATAYVLVLLLVAPVLGIVTGAIIPLVVLGFADQYSERKAQKRAT